MYTILNGNTGVIHALNSDYHPSTPYSLCGCVDPYLQDFSIKNYSSSEIRNSLVTCRNCRRILGPPKPPTTAILSTCLSNIMDNVKTFVLNSPECDHMITNRMEPMYKCRHTTNKIGTCEWLFCPLRKE